MVKSQNDASNFNYINQTKHLMLFQDKYYVRNRNAKFTTSLVDTFTNGYSHVLVDLIKHHAIGFTQFAFSIIYFIYTDSGM